MHKNKLLLLFLGLLLPAFLGTGLFFYYPVSADETVSRDDHQEGELLVKFKNNSEIYKFQVSPDLDIFSVINNYQGLQEIEYIEPNYKVVATAFPNDPDYVLQNYLSIINARDFWSKELLIRQQERIERQSVIAVLDTGVDLDHPDLEDKIWTNQGEIANNNIDDDNNDYRDDINGWDFVGDDNDPNPSFDGKYDQDAVKHGTIVSGIAAASVHNQQGISGLSWFSQIMPLRVLDSNGNGDIYSVIQAIDYAVANGADIINMSFIGSGFSQSLFNTIKRAYDQDVLLVAAAGNTDAKINGVDLDIIKSYPVCYDGSNGENMVIGVASVNSSLVKSNFSNYGSCVDLVAPGESFYSSQAYKSGITGFTKYYDGYWSGTSLSAPLVSGTLASIKALRPAFSVDQISSFVLENTKDISEYNSSYQGKLGAGLLDSAQALEAALTKRILPKEEKEGDNYIVAGLGLGSFPQIKVLRTDGTVFKSFYAYSPYFTGPINIAVGDVNGDDNEEIITGAGVGGGPHIRIFNIEGQLLSHFFAYDESFRGGVNIAVGDVNNDGIDEIITGIGKGGEPKVKIFDYQGNMIREFLAYNQNFTGGVKVAAGDVSHNGKADIITGAGEGGGPHVRIFEADGDLINQFFAYNENFRGGINVASGDLHNDGRAEIMVSIERNSIPTVRIFTYLGTDVNNFLAYDYNFLDGVYVAADDIDNDGLAEVITGPGIGGNSQIKVFDRQGILKFELFAHQQSYRGGVRPAVIRY